MPKGSRSGRMGGGSGLSPSDIVSTKDLISERERQETEVDKTLAVFKDVYDEYGSQIGQIQIAKLKPKANALAYFDGDNIAINQSYFDMNAMERAYKESVKQGFHPPQGNKTGMEAVVAHELGHKLTADVGVAMGKGGFSSIDETSRSIVNEARKLTGHKGVVQMAHKISGYATSSNAEAIAEAYSDVYCNGAGATRESKAIVSVLRKYLKK